MRPDPLQLRVTDLPVTWGAHRLDGVVGEGSRGRIFRARRFGPGAFERAVALKVVRSAGPEPFAEAELGARSDHPHVVPTLDAGVEGDLVWTEHLLVEGTSLRTLLANGPLTARATLEMAGHVASALQHLHDEVRPTGIVHGAVRPSNVLVDRFGRALLTDFGQAAPVGSAGSRLTPADDVLAVGVLIVQALTGHRLSLEPERASWLDRLLGRRPNLVAQARALGVWETAAREVPGLQDVLHEVLQEEASARIGSARDLLARLEGLAASGAGLRETVPQLGPPRLPSAPKRRPAEPPLVGRHGEVATLVHRLEIDGVLVTLKGPPGIGKSRLARHLRATWTGGHSRTLVHVPLASVTDDLGLAQAVAAALQVPVTGPDPDAWRLHLAHAMAARGPTVLVLDGVDGILSEVVEALAAWRPRAPRLSVLVTSRARLGVLDEVVVDVGPLDTAEAERLFVQRAAGPIDDAASVRALVASVDCVPLAIELLAARTALLSPEVLAARALSAPGGDDPVGTAVDAVLADQPPWARTALAQLASLAGPWRAEVAEAALDLTAHPGAPDPLQVLETLWAASLLFRVEDQGRRLAVYEAVRRRVLPERREPSPAVLARVATWFAARWDGVVVGRLQDGQHEALLADSALLRQVVATSVASPGPSTVGVVLARCALAERTGPAAEALPAVETLLSSQGIAGADRARLLLARGQLLVRTGAGADAAQVLAWAAEALEAWDLPRLGAWARARRGAVLADHGLLGLDDAFDELHAAVAGAEATHDPWVAAYARGWLGVCHRERAEVDTARAVQLQALDTMTELGDLRARGWLEGEIALLDAWEHEVERARAGYDRALDLLARAGDRFEEARVHAKVAALCLSVGAPADAAIAAERSRELCRMLGDRNTEGIADEMLAEAALVLGRPEEALRVSTRGLALRADAGDRVGEVVHRLQLAEAHLAQGDLAAAWGEATRSWTTAREHALTRLELAAATFRAEVALLAGDTPSAVALLEGIQTPLALGLAALARAQGGDDAARQAAQRLVQDLREQEHRAEAGVRLDAILAEIAALRGQGTAARAARARADAALDRMGAGRRSVLRWRVARVGRHLDAAWPPQGVAQRV